MQIYGWGAWNVETCAKTTTDTVKMKMASMLNVQRANNFYCLQRPLIYHRFNVIYLVLESRFNAF